MVAKMSKVQILGPRKVLNEVLDKIYSFGKVQIEKVSYSALNIEEDSHIELKDVSLGGKEAEELTKLEVSSKKIEGMLEFIEECAPDVIKKAKASSGNGTGKEEVSMTIARQSVSKLNSFVNKTSNKLDSIIAEKLSLEEQHGYSVGFGQIIQTFSQLMDRPERKDDYEILGFSISKKKMGTVDVIKEKVRASIGDDFEVFHASLNKREAGAIIACSAENMLKVSEIFTSENISECEVPNEYKGKSISEIVALLQDGSKSVPSSIQKVEEEIREFAERYANVLRNLKDEMDSRIIYYDAVPKFGETKFTFVMVGYIPTEDVKELHDELKGAYGDSILIDDVEVSADEKFLPVKLKNPAIFRPFEVILKAFSPPSYGTIDPTMFLGIFFPIIFGWILGDIGYGAILLTGGIVLRFNKSQIIKDVAYIVIVCAISTIIFGVIFGELFGNLGHMVGLHPPAGYDREKDVILPLICSVGFGLFHICLSLLLKAWTSYKQHHNKINSHVVEAFATLAVLISTALALTSATGVLPKSVMPIALIVIGVGIVTAFAAGGIAGGIEIFGILGNVLSYARIMAIGLSSVILAVVANKLFHAFPLVVGIMIALVLHTINIALGIFGPTIHGLRLHFVESMSKFTKLDGKEYRPFKEKGGN